jgi:predicted nucleic acid-binding protein
VIYLDTGILVRALLVSLPEHQDCFELINDDSVTSSHSVAETFNTLTGFFKVRNDIAADLILSLRERMTFEPISTFDYMKVIAESRSRGIQGGIVYDAVHAEIARRLRVDRLVTYNVTNFRHVAPDLNIASPT